MRWSLPQRHRPLRKRDGSCTVVDADEAHVLASAQPAVTVAPRDEGLRATALLAARIHAGGPAVAGASAAAASLQRLTQPHDPRRFHAWLLQGLYHRLAGAEARRAAWSLSLARAHEVRARSVLRLAATSPDRYVARRARAALQSLNAATQA